MDAWGQQPQQQPQQQPGSDWGQGMAPPPGDWGQGMPPPPADRGGMPKALLVILGIVGLLVAFGLGVAVGGDGREVTVTVTETVTDPAGGPVGRQRGGDDPQPESGLDAGPDEGEGTLDPEGQVTVSTYTFNDLQVSCDSFADFFTARARVSTVGSTTSAGFTLTLLDGGGSVVGTARGTTDNLEPEVTRTIEFFSNDACADFDQVDVQLDYEL